MRSLLSLVLSNLPAEWATTGEYNESYLLFDLPNGSEECIKVTKMFGSTQLVVNSIKRVQNPFQYGRFKLRQEMLGVGLVDTVFHVINVADLEIALKYTCDYRRYTHKYKNSCYKKQPNFYNNVHVAINDINGNSGIDASSIIVLVVSRIHGLRETLLHCDYYVQYVVDFI